MRADALRPFNLGSRREVQIQADGRPGRVGVRNPHRDRPRSATLARGLKLQACNFSTADGNLDDFRRDAHWHRDRRVRR